MQGVLREVEDVLALGRWSGPEAASMAGRIQSLETVHFGRCGAAQLWAIRQFLKKGTSKRALPYDVERSLHWLQRYIPSARPRRIDALHRAYRDVRPDDRYSLTYLPDVGTELRLNNELLASIPGNDFAEAYFGIWLGNQPLDEGLRDELLGRS